MLSTRSWPGQLFLKLSKPLIAGCIFSSVKVQRLRNQPDDHHDRFMHVGPILSQCHMQTTADPFSESAPACCILICCTCRTRGSASNTYLRSTDMTCCPDSEWYNIIQ